MAGNLGLKVKESKSVTQPCAVLEHLGFLLDVPKRLVSLPDRKIFKVTQLGRNILASAARNQCGVPKSVVARFAGYAQSLALALPFARF